jgi:hypothetical protein
MIVSFGYITKSLKETLIIALLDVEVGAYYYVG